jgi:hypothetical protein
MKKLLLLFYSLVLSANVFGQNLVPNPSFEVYDTCPNIGGGPYLSQIRYAVGWSSYRVTPDYYNSCAPDTSNPSWSVPSNIYGSQFARTGSAYGGLTTRGIVSTLREYIGIQLNQTLIQGERYYGSFYVSKAQRYLTVASNKIGMKVSTVAYAAYSNPAPTDNHAQIYTDSLIQDTMNWVRISGSFIADSAYRYLIIGNFFLDSLTSYIDSDSTGGYAYYYIDDVYLSTDSTVGISELPNQTQLHLFPNPTHSSFTLQCPLPIVNHQLTIFNSIGQEVFQTIINGSTGSPTNQSTIINPNLGAGVYYVRVASSPSTGSGTAATGAVHKLIIY